MQRVRLITLWLICCTCGCFGTSDNLSTDQLLSTTAQQQQQSSPTNSDNLLNIHSSSSFLSKDQLVRLRRSISRVLKDMRTIENGLLEPEFDRQQLINLQHKANQRMQMLERKISKFIRQSSADRSEVASRPANQQAKDQIEQQLSSTNQIKVIRDPKFFFSSSSSSSSLSPPVFLLVDASASRTGNSPIIDSGNSYSSVNYSSSNSSSSNSSNVSDTSPNRPQSKLDDINRQIVNSLPKELDLTAMSRESLQNIQVINSDADSDLDRHKVKQNLNKNVNQNLNQNLNQNVNKIKNKSNNFNKFSNHDFSRTDNSGPVIRPQTNKSHKRKQSFLLYHKCSEGYLQVSGNDNSLITGMDPDLISKSEFTIHYLTKPHNNQLQIQTKQGKYVCLNDQGRARIMVSFFCLICIKFFCIKNDEIY